LKGGYRGTPLTTCKKERKPQKKRTNFGTGESNDSGKAVPNTCTSGRKKSLFGRIQVKRMGKRQEVAKESASKQNGRRFSVLQTERVKHLKRKREKRGKKKQKHSRSHFSNHHNL